MCYKKFIFIKYKKFFNWHTSLLMRSFFLFSHRLRNACAVVHLERAYSSSSFCSVGEMCSVLVSFSAAEDSGCSGALFDLDFCSDFFTARIRMFFGVCSMSMNSRSWTLYPKFSRNSPRSASVKSAEKRSFIIPYFKSGLNSSGTELLFSWLFISCWQQGTLKIALQPCLTA